MQNDMTIYQNKSALCRTFGIGRQGIEVMEDMQVEQARDIEVLRHVEREMADAEYDPSPK